jgi:hypothetical protein
MRSVFPPAIFLALGILACNQEATKPDDTAKAYIRILEPQAGATIRLNADFRIITESDYDKFADKLTFSATPDSGKSWALIKSGIPRMGMKVLDTVICNFDALGFAAGQTTRIKVIEYGKVHYAISEPITILP